MLKVQTVVWQQHYAGVSLWEFPVFLSGAMISAVLLIVLVKIFTCGGPLLAYFVPISGAMEILPGNPGTFQKNFRKNSKNLFNGDIS
jgi:hypothetical protein